MKWIRNNYPACIGMLLTGCFVAVGFFASYIIVS